jgi:hypothetical protein
VVANNVVFLGGRDAGGAGRGKPSSQGADEFGPPPPEMMSQGVVSANGAAEEDVPF